MVDGAELCGVVVTYHPDEHVGENIRAMVAECGHVLVIDNGSSPAERAQLGAVPGVELIELGENLGIAAALNVGARRALAGGRRWIVTFDQDSTPRAGMIAALRVTAGGNPRAAVIVPCIIEGGIGGAPYRWVRQHPRARWVYQRVACGVHDLPEVTMAISSGSMIELETWARIGGFEEALFIDYVDIDFCLRVLRRQREIVVSAAAKLDHRLGARKQGRLLGHAFRPTHHPAFRHYYIARNRVWIWRRHAAAVPHWALFDLCFASYNLVRVVALEQGRWKKVKAIVLGVWDGLRGRGGPCPEERRRAFER